MRKFCLYFFLSFISNLCLICNVSALTYNGNLIEVNSSHYNGSTLLEYNNISTFVYDNYYYSDTKIVGTDFYVLGYNVQNFPQSNVRLTNNINFYMEKPCSSSDNLSYNLTLRFFKVSGSDDFNFSRLPVVLGNKGCSGYWQKNGDNWDYVLSCNLQPDNYVVGSLTFDYSTLPIPSGAYYHYRVAIQKNFDYSCTINSQSIIQNNNINTQNIIDNQSSNTQTIINNQDSNTQSIIDNQNSNTQAQIESQKSCTTYTYDDASNVGKMLNYNGVVVNNNNYSLTDYININGANILNTVHTGSGFSGYYCFYDSSKTKISCSNISNIDENSQITIPSNAYFIRISISRTYQYPNFKICKNGNQALTDSLNDDNVNGAEKDASDFFSNFTTDTHGLTGIITAPLSAIESLTSATCSPLTLPLPFIDEDLELPCMRSIYEDFFGDFIDIYDIVVLGVLSYWIMVRIFAMVKDFKNPEHDEVEVMEL